MNRQPGRNDPCSCGSGKKYKKCCLGRPVGPAVELEEAGERWTITLRNFEDFEAALSRDVLRAFCRCFVQVDRLTSTISCIHGSEQLHGRDSVAFGRDLHAMVWFTIGTLREFAAAIRDLRSALAKRNILQADSAPWVALREVERRWEDDDFFRRMRDRAAFHVDREIIDRGLDELVKERDVDLCQGQGPKSSSSSLTLGLLAMHNGLGMDLEAYGAFLERVTDDHGIGHAVQEAFVLAARAVGIAFGDQ
jgi:hypothetical protein